MQAAGCFAVCVSHPPDAGRPSPDAALGRMRRLCGSDDELRTLASADGRCAVGSLLGPGQDRWLSLRSDPASGAAGAFDGWTFTPSLLTEHPERLGTDDLDLRINGNGMYTTVAWQGAPGPALGPGPGTGALQRAMLYFLTDPFGTTPLYYGEHDGIFACAASLPLVAAALGLGERNEEAEAELLCFGEILTDATPVRGIRRAEPGTLYAWDAQSGALRARRTWSPVIGQGDLNPRHAVEQAAETFVTAVRRTVAAAPAPVHAALTGGIDSRTVWAVLLHDRTEAAAVVHAAADDRGEGLGHDLAIARMIARRFGITLKEVLLGEDFLRDAAADLPRFLQATNGLCSGDLLHLPHLYRVHGGYTSAIIDGVNSYSERRHGLRRAAAGASTRESLAAALWKRYFSPALPSLLPADTARRVLDHARARLADLAPDPRDFPSPAVAAEHLYLTRLIGRHGNDAAALQNHRVRFLSPYFDLDYVETLLRVPEPLRAAERVQDAVLRRNAPPLRRVPRAYAQVRTWPVVWRPLRLLPVAAQRLLIDRLPAGMQRRLDLRRGGDRYAAWFGGPLALLFAETRRNPGPFDPALVEDFLDGFAAGTQGDTHAAGFLLGQFSPHAGS